MPLYVKYAITAINKINVMKNTILNIFSNNLYIKTIKMMYKITTPAIVISAI